MKRALMTALAALGWFALVLQLAILVVFWSSNGGGVANAVSRFLAYFTILTNILVASSLTLQLAAPGSAEARFLERPAVASGIMIAIGFVCVIYALVLQRIWEPRGAQLVADVILHYVVPLGYLLYWLAFVPRGRLQWRHAVWWAAYPVAYLLYALARGELTGFYAYPFIDVGAIGYGRMLVNALLLCAAFVFVGLLVVAFDRTTGRRLPQPAPGAAT